MKTEIIAEIAQGYEGKPLLAELLVRGAIASGADSVKLQLVYADELCVKSYPYYDLFKSLEMPIEQWRVLVRMAHDSHINIYFDVYGMESLKVAKKLGCDGVKISTTDFYNTALIDNSFKLFKKVFISTSGIPSDDLDGLVNNCPDDILLTLLHGFQAEPTNTEDNNLARISTLRTRYRNVDIGFMDHSVGSHDEAYYLPMIALGQGVTCIEKHITLDYSLEIEDYVSALSIDRFKKFTQLIRTYERALGSSSMDMSQLEIEYKQKSGKIIVAARDIKKGTQLLPEHLAMKRVSTKPSKSHFSQMKQVVGISTTVNIKKDEPISNRVLP
jgi:N,N'-diacetyllegionaminate synthase